MDGCFYYFIQKNLSTLKCLKSNFTPPPPAVTFEYVNVVLLLSGLVYFCSCAVFPSSLVWPPVFYDGLDRTQQANYQKMSLPY